jgi:DNA repair photolyase
LMAPVVPGFTTQPARLEATVKAIAEHGAAFMGANLLYLKGGTRDHFMAFLAAEFPHLVDGYNRLYPRAYAPSGYVAAVRSTIDALQKRYELDRRVRPADSTVNDAPMDRRATPGAADQPGFAWGRP